MRSFSAISASALVFAVGAVASSPGVNWGGNWGVWKQPVWSNPNGQACMSDSDAQGVANNFQGLIANYSDALATAALTPNFHDYTDSVIELIDSACPNFPVPLGIATFSNRTAFEAGQSSQPAIPFKQLNIWHNCDTVTLRWESQMNPATVTGIIVLEAAYSNSTWQIQTVFSEFNSGAWLVDLGVFKPANCSA